MFSITGLEFSYSQAPESMKSVLQACWLLTVAFGNIIVIIVAEAKAFNDQASEFFMFAVLMIVDMFIFMGLAWRYVPRKRQQNKGIASFLWVSLRNMKASFCVLPCILATASAAPQLLVRGAGQMSHQSVSKPFQGTVH